MSWTDDAGAHIMRLLLRYSRVAADEQRAQKPQEKEGTIAAAGRPEHTVAAAIDYGGQEKPPRVLLG